MSTIRMTTYQLGNYELSKNLKRFARKGGQDGDPKYYTLGECKVEFLKEQGTFYTAEPVLLAPKEPIEKIDIDPETGLQGKFALQTQDLEYCMTVEDKDKWLSDRPIQVPENSTLEATISKELTSNRQDLTPENAELAKKRLTERANTPETDTLTVRAIFSHTGLERTRKQHIECIKELAKATDLTYEAALWLANCHNDGKIVYEEDCWCTPESKFYVPPTTEDLNKLVDCNLMNFTGEYYTSSDLGRQYVEAAYL